MSGALHGTFAGPFGKRSPDGTRDGGAQFTSGDSEPVCEPVTGSIRPPDSGTLAGGF
jgi:hypothetical protein